MVGLSLINWINCPTKVIRRAEVTDASVHDSQVLDPANAGSEVWPDSSPVLAEPDPAFAEAGTESLQSEGPGADGTCIRAPGAGDGVEADPYDRAATGQD